MIEKKVEKISYSGLEVYTDAYALKDCDIMFLSIFGNKTAVKGIWSALLIGRWIDLFTDYEREIHVNQDNKWRIYTKVLPSKIAQAILIPKQLCIKRMQEDFAFIAKENPEESFFLFLNKASKIPLKKEWACWLFEKALQKEMLIELTSLNIKAFYYEGNDEWLCQAVTTGIQEGTLT
ncbi:hypothetical protein KAR91_61220 [Candidatus Pacearchaeota archaeon]|nr:hypothetical protein [Candidatus Pacearchaeota archaeon]